jgi:hypothetical protein
VPETGELAMGESLPKFSGVLTGNPFVDWGLSIAAAMADLGSVAALTNEHLKKVVGDGRALARRHQRLKAFIPVFGSNTPLHNPKPKGQGPGEAHVKNYASLLVRIRDAMSHETSNLPCEICGASRSLDVTQLRDSAGRTPSFGRDWLPLAGAATEANLWPAATRSPHTCARCLLAVRLLPSALLLVDGRLMVLQSAPPEFADIFVRELYDHVRVREQAGETETVGSKEGKRALARRLLSVLNRLRLQQRLRVVDSTTRVFAWYFTNAGDSAEVALEELPNRALLFLRDAVDSGLGSEIERLIAGEPRKDTEWTPGMLRCLEQGRDYEHLYPRGKHLGGSIELFELYQARVLGRTTCALEVAHAIATELASAVRRQEDLDSLRKPEAFRRPELRARVRRAMVRMAAEGRFSLADYRSLFPVREGPGIAVVDDGWKVLRYYVHQPTRKGRQRGEPPSALPHTDPVSFIADRVLDRLLAARGEEFVRDLVAHAERTDDRWLREQFLACAWREEGFTCAGWSALALDGRGRFAAREWVFQTRLHLAARLSEDPHRRVLRGPARQAAAMPMSDSNLPEFVAVALEEYLGEYLTVRGPGRLERDIVRPWLARRLGTHWLGERLSSPRRRAAISAHAWRGWLEEPDGAWRAFQLGLALCNAARRLIAMRSTRVEEPA